MSSKENKLNKFPTDEDCVVFDEDEGKVKQSKRKYLKPKQKSIKLAMNRVESRIASKFYAEESNLQQIKP